MAGTFYFAGGLFLMSLWTYIALLGIDTIPAVLFLVVLLVFMAIGLHGLSLFTAGTAASVDESLDSYTTVFFKF